MKTRSDRIKRLASRLHPMIVREYRVFSGNNTYAVCPRCRVSMEREYVRYCNNCGQKLNWAHYENQE